MTAAAAERMIPAAAGRLTPDAPLAPLVWFKSGGNAEWLFEPILEAAAGARRAA